MIFDYEVGDVVQFKKKHPCGSDEWLVSMTGVEFRLKCLGCQHEIYASRVQVEKRTKKIKKA